MGYTTEFEGSIHTKNGEPIPQEIADYIRKFNEVRHMKRNNKLIKIIDKDWEKHCYRGNLGESGEFYIVPEKLPLTAFSESERKNLRREADIDGNIKGYFGQSHDMSIENYNMPPSTQPGLWCQWTVTEDNRGIGWNLGEKFYHYVAWLEYILNQFLTPNDILMEGDIYWCGEDRNDRGTISVKDNVVSVTYSNTVDWGNDDDDDDDDY